MKKRYIIILVVVLILFSISIICTTVKENNRSVVSFSYNYEYKININTATAEELSYLPGIGIDKAKRIVAYREEEPFKEISDIMNVKGIGKSIYKQIQSLVTV